ncbi:hypothetical protein [Microbulbifer agarilyticus]|uniref:hypothetical protein n=1 Tax=Microbulbifer agarilyticus TaxID=260552 RepID=UPI001CD2DFD7|nr:hypothetical protein [Microbulbifer agarilyticus]MCA0894906.1 hypothetical protein [Microbulbifer agarilyticus]
MDTEEITYIVLYLLLLVAYFTAAFFTSRWLWRRLEQISYMVKIPLRAGVLTFFFAPTVFACGAAAFVPFSVLLVTELVSEPTACSGQIGFALPTLAIFWALCVVVYLSKLAIGRLRA